MSTETSQIFSENPSGFFVFLKALDHLMTSHCSMQRGRRWCFTWNNYDEQEAINKLSSIQRMGFALRIVVGREIAPSTGTPHLQGYIHFSKRFTMNKVKSDLNQTVHLEIARGSEDQNIRYCSKGENLLIDWAHPAYDVQSVERRLLKKQDKQEETREILDSFLKMKTSEFEAIFPYQAFHWATKLRDWRISHTAQLPQWSGDLKAKNFWVWGAAGTGKSRWARQVTRDTSYPKNLNKWWDGYDVTVHRSVIIEDIDPTHGQWAAQLMKVWSDRYRFLGETKGSGVMVQPGTFFLIVTSNYPISEVFQNSADMPAIKRRFSEIHISGPQDITFNTQLPWDILQEPIYVSESDNQE